MKWISVDDRLPDSYIECLVYPIPNSDMNIISAAFQPLDKKWSQDCYNGYDYEEFEPVVTHWIPLSPPPPNR